MSDIDTLALNPSVTLSPEQYLGKSTLPTGSALPVSIGFHGGFRSTQFLFVVRDSTMREVSGTSLSRHSYAARENTAIHSLGFTPRRRCCFLVSRLIPTESEKSKTYISAFGLRLFLRPSATDAIARRGLRLDFTADTSDTTPRQRRRTPRGRPLGWRVDGNRLVITLLLRGGTHVDEGGDGRTFGYRV